MPIRCPNCHEENPIGTFICAKCHQPLIKLDIPQTSTTLLETQLKSDLNLPPAVDEVRSETRRKALMRPDTVALYMGGYAEPLILQIGTQAILGRYTPHSVSQPRVDLSPYGAFEKGVSRMHVILRRTEHGLMIEDMASSNGTWVNDVRLHPYTAMRLNSGDRIRLSQLDMSIFLGGTTEEDASEPTPPESKQV